jgi:CheY-like chemotaxis protein
VPHTLLLADDSVTIQRVIELTFADEDIQVVSVGDGDQAIARIEASPPDIILADIGMPGKSGYEVAQYVKRSPRLSHIPVVLLTGAFEPVDQPMAAAAGCDGVMAKPFEPQLVIGRVKELLAKSLGASAQATTPAAPPVSASTQATTPAAPPVSASAQAATLAGSSSPPSPSSPSSAPAAAAGDMTAAAPSPPDSTLARAPVPPTGATSAPSTWPPPAPSSWPPMAEQTRTVTLEPPSPGAADLNNYFDRLDEAFASLTSAGPAASPPEAAAAADLDWVAATTKDPPAEIPVSYASSQHDFDRPPVATRWQPAHESAPIAPVPIPEPLAAPGASAAASSLPSVGDAFAALLAAEQTGASPPVVAQWPAPQPAAAITADVVDEVARRVLDRLSDRVIRETVTGIVSDIAERLIREEIDRIKASMK